jgi:hypothetical protein
MKFDPLFHGALECGFNSDRPVQFITGQIRTKDHAWVADQPQFAPLIKTSAFLGTNLIATVESGNHLALELEARCLTATAVMSFLAGRNNEISVRLVRHMGL